MATFVALLGGINVGGHRVTMDRLRAEVTDLGLVDVRTFIASGNLLFDAPKGATTDTLADRLSSELAERLGWPVPTYVRTAAQIVEAADLAPFGVMADGHTHMVAFCRSSPDATVTLVGTADDTRPDRFVVHGTDVHWHIAGTLTSSSITLPKLARLLGQPCTTRNITTVRALAGLVR
jgi:uncharacterized protein (DUF1697 family)